MALFSLKRRWSPSLVAPVHHPDAGVDGNELETEVLECFNYAGTQAASASLETPEQR